MNRILTFISGAFSGPDGKASMCKCMAWAVLTAILISWFILPKKGITELTAVFGVIMGYGLGGKMSWNKNNPSIYIPSEEIKVND